MNKRIIYWIGFSRSSPPHSPSSTGCLFVVHFLCKLPTVSLPPQHRIFSCNLLLRQLLGPIEVTNKLMKIRETEETNKKSQYFTQNWMPTSSIVAHHWLADKSPSFWTRQEETRRLLFDDDRMAHNNDTTHTCLTLCPVSNCPPKSKNSSVSQEESSRRRDK